MTPEEYEAAFHGIDLPDTLELFPGVVVSNMRGFIDNSIHILRTSTSTRVIETVKYRLDRAIDLLDSQP